ncbi:hypothetical protein AVEN_248779-1 [Araneus ventricosus]|uniref:Uncharacterized protein n=1 Tax=Araneus ventricosus TaxID=182803 RepID=A0A4Y2KUE4_ARAVE|nr:hypothetical protein AVEN_248779-1 [Araneus ventricosus]
MNMPAESSPFAFPKLDGSNYTSWKEDMKVVLMDRGCWSFIVEDNPCPEQATEKEKFEYDWRKQRCYTTIYQGIERKFLPLIRYTTDGKEAWNILKTNFEPTSKARLAVLIDEFFELKFNPVEETIGIFCKRVDEKKTQVKEAGFEIPELLIALQLIRRLPAEYDHLVQTLYRLKDEEFNHLEVEKQLVNEAGRIQLKQKDLNLDYASSAPSDHFVCRKLARNLLNAVEQCWTLQETLVNTGKSITLKEWGRLVNFVPAKDTMHLNVTRSGIKRRNKLSYRKLRSVGLIKPLEYRRTAIIS